MNGPGSDNGEGAWQQTPKPFFDEKLASGQVFTYNPSSKERWANGVRNYFVGKCHSAKRFIKWIEDRQSRRIEQSDVEAAQEELMVDVNLVQLSAQMWSWLHINLQGVDTAMTLFENVESLNGA